MIFNVPRKYICRLLSIFLLMFLVTSELIISQSGTSELVQEPHNDWLDSPFLLVDK